MSSNFERLQKIINQAYAENFMWNPEIFEVPIPVGKMTFYVAFTVKI